MRKEFIKRLHELMSENDDIVLLTGDLGFGLLDQIRDDFSDRFYNCGASEAAMSDIAVGLALSGKLPFMYTITPFYYRCFETLRTYINHEVINVKMIGSGRDDSYKHDGFSHDASDIYYFMDGFVAIGKYYPDTNEEAIEALNDMMKSKNPSFIALQR